MSQLIKREKDFLLLLLSTSHKQRKALLGSIEKSQLSAIIQIVYNILHGFRALSDKDKKLLSRRKVVIREFVSKGVSINRRKRLLIKFIKYILPFVSLIKSELV